MVKSALFGRRVHIAGSVPNDLIVASTGDVQQARELVQGLVRAPRHRDHLFHGIVITHSTAS